MIGFFSAFLRAEKPWLESYPVFANEYENMHLPIGEQYYSDIENPNWSIYDESSEEDDKDNLELEKKNGLDNIGFGRIRKQVNETLCEASTIMFVECFRYFVKWYAAKKNSKKTDTNLFQATTSTQLV